MLEIYFYNSKNSNSHRPVYYPLLKSRQSVFCYYLRKMKFLSALVEDLVIIMKDGENNCLGLFESMVIFSILVYCYISSEVIVYNALCINHSSPSLLTLASAICVQKITFVCLGFILGVVYPKG